MTHEERLARHVATLDFEALPEPVRERAKYLLLDHLGIAIRAAEGPASSQSVREAVRALGWSGSGTATVLGTGRSASPEHAALLNATFGHSLELDDTHRYGSLHPGVAVIPAALAAAERDDASGTALLRGIVAGYDVACRVGRAVNVPAHYAQGFHPTATCGTFGAIAAVAAVEGRSTEALLDALGAGGSLPSGMMQYLANGAWNKRLHPGLAASAGLLADALGGAGFLGAAEPVTGEKGFLHGYTTDPDPEALVDGLGDRYEVTETGIKPHACCRASHGAIDATLALREAVDPDDVRSVEVELYETGMDLVGRPLDDKQTPENVVDAQFSLPFAVAVALREGEATLDVYDEATLADPEIRSLMRTVRAVPSAEYEAAYPQTWPTTVRVETGSGVHEHTVTYPRGEPENGLSWAEMTGKFAGLAEGRLDDPSAAVDVVRSLESRSVGELTAALAE